MTLAAIDWLSISINLLLVIFVIVCLLMTLIILMQRPKQEGLGAAFGGGVTDQVFGARTTNVLQRGTVYCGTLFFVLALLLAILISHQNKDSDLLKKEKAATGEVAADVQPGEATEPAPVPDKQDLPASLQDELPEEAPKPEEAPEPEAAPIPEEAPQPETAPQPEEAPQAEEAPVEKP